MGNKGLMRRKRVYIIILVGGLFLAVKLFLLALDGPALSYTVISAIISML